MHISVSKSITFWLLVILLLAAILRLVALPRFPPALYSDETNQGYNAYSLLLTGRDEHGIFLPVSLRSFGDWKPPLPTYLMIPFILLFGLTEFSVRLPSALLGIISIYLSFLLTKFLIGKEAKTMLLVAFFMAISPWHIHQSRSAMLVMVSLTTLLFGTVLFFLGSERRSLLILSATFFSLSIYSYYGMRLIIPLWILVLLWQNYRRPNFFARQIIPFFFTLIVILLPLAAAYLHESNVIFGRAKTVSIFYDRGVDLRLWEYASEDAEQSPLMTRFFHNKIYLYSSEVVRRFFSHLDGRFLFLSGDNAPPFLIPRMGVLYLVDMILIIIGSLYLIRDSIRGKWLIIILLFLSILPAALTYQTPSHNRSFNASFVFLLLASSGLIYLLQRFKQKMIILLITAVYILQMREYLYNYFYVLPHGFASQWLYGLKEVVALTNEPKMLGKRIIFLPSTNIAYIYFLFYNRYDPRKFWQEVRRDYIPDEFGFEHVGSFDRFISLRQGIWEEISKPEQTIFVGRMGEIPESDVTNHIQFPDGKTAFVISIR